MCSTSKTVAKLLPIGRRLVRSVPSTNNSTTRATNDHATIEGFLVVDKLDENSFVMFNDNIDQQQTRQAETCVHEHTSENNVDVDQIQILPTLSSTSNLVALPQISSSSASVLINRKLH